MLRTSGIYPEWNGGEGFLEVFAHECQLHFTTIIPWHSNGLDKGETRGKLTFEAGTKSN